MYNFDETIDRRNTNSMKWDGARQRLTPEQAEAQPLPMWVADMDFKIAPPIMEALQAELDQGILGYSIAPDSYAEAVIDWQARRFGWRPQREWLLQSPGVVNALNMAIQAFSMPGDSIIVQSPVYVHFHHDVVVNGRRVIEVPMTLHDGRYHFDAAAFEAAIQPNTRIFILCNPHNPTGNVWTREELTQMAVICQRHGIIVIADEIHQDFVFGQGASHYAYGLLAPELVAGAIICTAPSKTFNLAGLQCSNLFIPDAGLRQRYKAQAERCGLNLINKLGIAACEAAYRHGDAWVDELVAYVGGNQQYFEEAITRLGHGLRVTPTPSLYLAWIDFRALGKSPAELHDFLLRRARLWLDPGTKFGPAGAGFMRINLACTRAQVERAVANLAAALAG